jgi:hypothetical protein
MYEGNTTAHMLLIDKTISDVRRGHPASLWSDATRSG